MKQSANAKKLFIKTYGCQMNVYDSNRMADALAPQGYTSTDNIDDADLVVLNTCHIREKAAEKVYSELGRLRKMRVRREQEGGTMMIGVAGCVAQAEGEEILHRAPVVDLVFGPQSYHRLPELLDKARNSKVVETDFPAEDKFEHLPKPAKAATIARGLTAFLTVQEGCDKFCTFCVVPYTRGSEVSRPVARILDEAQHLADAGVKEITLLGQNVNAYHGRDGDTPHDLARLLYRLCDVKGLARLRYTTSHPRDMNDALVEAHRNLDILMPYLHLPVQSGSDRILKAMNRQHTTKDYLELIDRIRSARPDIAMSGDFIVGFPGETDKDFDDTMQIARDVGYAQAYSFKYSARPGTPGAALNNHVPEDVKSDRLARLQALLNQQQGAFNASCVGTTMPVLFEKAGRKEGQLVGRSPYLQPVQVEADNSKIGTIQDVVIDSVGKFSLFGNMTV